MKKTSITSGKKPYLNLGCGNYYHKDWVNIDFAQRGNDVEGYNLLNGIPYTDGLFEVAYHSHVLEHFTEAGGKKFIQDCFRVLKSNGLIRIAIPDLEGIIKQYFKHFEEGLNGDKEAIEKHKWNIVELIDQPSRHFKGGQMAAKMRTLKEPMRSYVINRHGVEAQDFYDVLEGRKQPLKNDPSLFRALGKLKDKVILAFLGLMGGSFAKEAYQVGKFRLGGEVHLWMYDRLSLAELLKEVGFVDVQVKDGFSSQIPDFSSYNLDVVNGKVRKPDSLFIEARKP